MAEERIDIVVAQRGATEVKRDLESIGQGARASVPGLSELQSAVQRITNLAQITAGPTSRLKDAMAALGPAADIAGLNIQKLGPATDIVISKFGETWAVSVRLGQAINQLNAAASTGGGLVALGASASTALVPVASLGTALIVAGASFLPVQTGAATTAVAVLSASTSLSTMTISIAELSRRLVALGYLLAALRDRFSQLRITDQSARQLTDFAARARDITPAVQPASQALLTFQGTAQSTGSVLGGFFANAFSRLQGIWGGFTNGIRNVWNSILGLGGAAGGAVPPINNLGAGMAAAGGAAGGAAPAVNGLTLSFFSLWRVLLALTIIRQVTQAIFDSIDSWTQMSNKLRQVSTDSENLRATQEAVYQSAQLTRSGMEEIATLYSRTAQATRTLGLSQREVMDITETVAMAMKLNGGSVQESASAMRQLSQAFNKGKLDGDEFRSIMENAPALQRAFAQSLGVSTGELMRMSKAGELTLPKLITALQEAGPSIRAAFGDSLPLISEGFTYLGNAVTRFLGQLNEATGFSLGFYNAMKFIGDNLGILGVALAGIGAAVLVAFGPAAISAVVGFGAAVMIAIGPLGWIAGAIAAIVAAIYVWGDSWKVTADGITVLDYIRAALEIVGEYVGVVAKFIGDAFRVAWNFLVETWGTIAEFFGSNFGTVMGTAQSAVGTVVGVWVGGYYAIVAAFEALPPALLAIFQLAMNGAIQVVQDGLNGIIGAINSVLEAISIPLIPTVDLSGWKQEINEGALDVGSKVGEAFNRGMADGRAGVDGLVTAAGNAIDRLTERARAISEARRAAEANTPQLGTAGGPNTFNPDADGSGAKAAKKLSDELNSLLRTIDPITGAQEKLRQGTETLDKAYAAGLITLERRNELLGRLQEHLRDQLDPLGKINRDMEKEASLLRMGNQEREIQKQLLDDIEKLRKAGVNLSPMETKQLEDQIRALQALKDQAKLLEDVLTRTFKAAEDAFVEFVETGKVDFSKLITSLISDLARLAFQSFVTKPLQGMLQGFLGNLLGGFGGGFGSIFGGAGSGTGYFPPAPIGGGGLYATGGSWVVGGQGGVDSQMVQFRASPGERVTVERNGGNGGGGNSTVVFNITTPDVRGFKASESQIAARMQRLAARGNRNM
ncbi:tape measure protein [Rhodobacter phage RcSimone-Hastad]|nr:tape measure protein [Rhodobacter phage RcSimone-Hastad]